MDFSLFFAADFMFPSLIPGALKIMDGNLSINTQSKYIIIYCSTEYRNQKIQLSRIATGGYSICLEEKYNIRECAINYLLDPRAKVLESEKQMWRGILENILSCAFTKDNNDTMINRQKDWPTHCVK